MKNNAGYLLTNPYDGTAMGSSTRAGTTSITSSAAQKTNFIKMHICGFHNNGDLALETQNIVIHHIVM